MIQVGNAVAAVIGFSRRLRRWLCPGTFLLLALCGLAGVPSAGIGAEPTPASNTAAEDPSRGQEMLARFVEVNRYWLSGPPPEVRLFSYVLNRVSGRQEFEVTAPQKAPRAQRQGVTYSALVHQLAQAPQSATVREIRQEPGRVRLVLTLNPAVRGACGNGVEGGWNGYHTIGGSDGVLVLDSERWVPLEASIGRLHETFGEYVRVDEQHYVPLTIRIQIEETRYDWRFRVYAPGLWLLDESYAGDRRLAWVEQVRVNAAPAQLAHATAASLQQEAQEQTGQARLLAVLKTNRHWLLPSLQLRRGLVYEYRQEAPYLERMLIDPEGNLLARLEASKESPTRPARQHLWLADGRSYVGQADDRFVKLEAGANPEANPDAWLLRDRLVQHLAMGLALDCALTRVAREPDQFWAEVRPVPNRADCYLLVLRPKQDARLFTGTMLAFTSWSYLHDVRYERSEILCDATTHLPLQEKDYAGGNELKASYSFEDWRAGSAGAVPGRIVALLPADKDGKDQSMEMHAYFHFPKEGIWLLDRVESFFRGGTSGSTGTVSIVAAKAEAFQPIRDLLQRASRTEEVFRAIQQGPVGSTEKVLKPGEWSALALQAAWTPQARESAQDREKSASSVPWIGLHRARVVPANDGTAQVELEGVSTALWKEFQTDWKISLRDDAGRVVARGATNLTVRAESGPTPFLVRMELPRTSVPTRPLPERVTVEGTVQRLNGAYHGHGLWMRFANQE